MVGVSVCHHVRVGIRSRKAALLELCGLLQVRVASIRTTLLVEQEEGFIFCSPKESRFFSSSTWQTVPNEASDWCQAWWLRRLIGNPSLTLGGQEARRPRREGSEGLRPGLPGCRPRGRSGELRNNDSGLQEEEGAPVTLSLLLCGVPVPKACPLEKTLKAALVLTTTHHHLKQLNLANDMQVFQDGVIAENLQRTPSAEVLNTPE